MMHIFFLRLSRLAAYLGGAMLTALILLTCVSIVGRGLNTALHSDMLQSAAPDAAAWLLSLGIGPVAGDFELVQAGMAFCIFAFLPLCQITGSHASVDVFTSLAPDRVNRVLRLIAEILFALVMVLIAVQLFEGLRSKLRTGQTTFLLEFPLWRAYALSFVGAAVAAVVAVYVACARCVEAATGRALLPADLGADH